VMNLLLLCPLINVPKKQINESIHRDILLLTSADHDAFRKTWRLRLN
jgi:hypothetical protein